MGATCLRRVWHAPAKEESSAGGIEELNRGQHENKMRDGKCKMVGIVQWERRLGFECASIR